MHAYRLITFDLQHVREDVVMEQNLPMGDAFFDPFELGHLFPPDTWSLLGRKNAPVDLESPFIRDVTPPSSLRLRLHANTSGTFKIPMHARYPIPILRGAKHNNASGRYIILVPPATFTGADGATLAILSDATNSTSNWDIPCGAVDDFYLVLMLILLLLWMALFAVGWTLLRRKKSIKIKK